MKAPVRNFIIRDDGGTREAETLVIGRGIPLSTTAGGLPELESLLLGQTQLMPSGGDDTQAIRDALARFGGVRLGPGEFNVSGTISLGTGQSVAGCGSLRTTVRSTHAGAAFDLAGSGTSIRELELRGPGDYVIGSRGVVATGATDVRLRGLRVLLFDRGVALAQPSRVEVSQVKVLSVNAGISLIGPGAQAAFSNVDVDGAQGWGISVASMDCVSFTRVTVRDCAPGIQVSGCSSLEIQAARISDCGEGLVLLTTRGAEVGGVHVFQCGSGIRVEGSLAVMLNGCSMVRVEETTLILRNCTAVTASGLLSDRTGQIQAVPPHVLVDGGSTQVVLSGVQRVNPPVPPLYEVDVSGAGGRVVFIQHNFDPARINSGGNFAAL
ncbi:MAG: right-handed parallel beta-helix repeat-containing protein [Longimicrobiaceae bacterium]